MPFTRTRFVRRRRFGRRRQNWQWVRQVFNNTTVSTPPSFYTTDLLADWKSRMNLTLNLPDIVIWRLRLKVSIRILYPATLASEESSGAVIAVYVDDTIEALAASNPNPVTQPYAHQFMLYDALYSTEMVVQSGIQPVSNGTFQLFREYDIRARRRLKNLNDSLMFDIAGFGNIASIQGFSAQTALLMKVGR